MRPIRYLLALALIIGIIEKIEAEEVVLEKIIITNRRTPVGLSEVTGNVTVVSAEEIEQLPARNLSEALKYIAGVDIEPRQGFARTTSVSIQGSDSRQVRVMIDGIPLNTQSSGQVDLTKFPIENIARIEVIKGAASSIWGSSLGGVVNIITKDTGTSAIPKGSITTSFAEFRTRKESFDLAGKVDDFGYYLFSSYMESGGQGSKDDVLEKKAFGKLSYTSKFMGKIIASFGYSGADTNSGEYPDGSWEAKPYQARYGKIGWELDCGDADVNVDFKHSRQKVTTNSYDAITDEEPSSLVWYKDMLYQLSLNLTTRLREKDLLVLGGDFDWDTVNSVQLSEAKDLKSQAVYANYTLKSEPWDLNLGLRYDHNSEFGEEVSPALGAVYHLKNIPHTLIRAGVSRAFNAPPLLWKYYERVVIGLTADNPGIGPERAWVYGLGLESKPTPRLRTKLFLYRADVSDAIGNAQNDAGDWIKKNFQKFRRQGVELQLAFALTEGLSLSASGAFNDIEDRTTKQTVRGGGKPRQSFDAGIEYKNKNGLGLSLRGYYDRWNQPASCQPNDRKMLCDLKMWQEFKNLSLFLNIYNLTNSKYWADYFFPVPERYFEGGATFRW